MFDPANKQHRAYFYEFLERGTWGRCPYRFIIQEGHRDSLVIQIQKMLLNYYINAEFQSNQKSKESVDKKIKPLYNVNDAVKSI
jgi:hypothetical protein